MSASLPRNFHHLAPTALTCRTPYPEGLELPKDTKADELGMFALKGQGTLTQLLAVVSDCAYPYELANDFHDGDMKIAYLTMKRAWESGGDDTAWRSICLRNRKAFNWSVVMLIWAFVLDSHDDYWAKIAEDLPEGLTPKHKEVASQLMLALRKFRNEWKELHEAKRISDILVSFKDDGFSIYLYGK